MTVLPLAVEPGEWRGGATGAQVGVAHEVARRGKAIAHLSAHHRVEQVVVLPVGAQIHLIAHRHIEADASPPVVVADAVEHVWRERQLHSPVPQVGHRNRQLRHGVAQAVVARRNGDAPLGRELPAVAFPLRPQGHLGVEAAGLLPAVVAHQQAGVGLVVGIKPAVAHLAAGAPEAAEIAVGGGVRVSEPAALVLPERREEAEVPQDQTGRLPQAEPSGVAAVGAGAQSDHGADARITLQDVRGTGGGGHRGCGIGEFRLAGEHRQLVGLIRLLAEHIGGAAHPQHLAAQAGPLRAVDQHRAGTESKALLAEANLAVAPQETQRPPVEQQFRAAVARAQLLALAGRLVHPGLLGVDVHLLAIDDPADRGALERCGLGRWQQRRRHEEPSHGHRFALRQGHAVRQISSLLGVNPPRRSLHGRFPSRTRVGAPARAAPVPPGPRGARCPGAMSPPLR